VGRFVKASLKNRSHTAIKPFDNSRKGAASRAGGNFLFKGVMKPYIDITIYVKLNGV